MKSFIDVAKQSSSANKISYQTLFCPSSYIALLNLLNKYIIAYYSCVAIPDTHSKNVEAEIKHIVNYTMPQNRKLTRSPTMSKIVKRLMMVSDLVVTLFGSKLAHFDVCVLKKKVAPFSRNLSWQILILYMVTPGRCYVRVAAPWLHFLQTQQNQTKIFEFLVLRENFFKIPLSPY